MSGLISLGQNGHSGSLSTSEEAFSRLFVFKRETAHSHSADLLDHFLVFCRSREEGFYETSAVFHDFLEFIEAGNRRRVFEPEVQGFLVKLLLNMFEDGRNLSRKGIPTEIQFLSGIAPDDTDRPLFHLFFAQFET